MLDVFHLLSSPDMCLPSVMVLPLLIVVFAGVYYVYSEVKRFMSESMVRNKVVVITDAVSEMGKCGRRLHEGGISSDLCMILSFMWHLVSYCLYFLYQTFTPKLVLCVDMLICNSSMKIKAPVHINYFRPITLAKGVLLFMIIRRTGQFVLVNMCFPDAASKHAVQAFSECLRAEVEEYGISVSTISHTFINTPSQTPPSIPLWACE
uniref:Dehydrogenase/reductase (SDR family) member 7Cb n=1 Tax=Cyprinus carpio carpio TaxID=630221 RepID=A0A9J8CPW9_CYPCA